MLWQSLEHPLQEDLLQWTHSLRDCRLPQAFQSICHDAPPSLCKRPGYIIDCCLWPHRSVPDPVADLDRVLFDQKSRTVEHAELPAKVLNTLPRLQY